MLKVINQQEVKVLLEQKKGGRKPIVFKSEIDGLKQNHGLIITEKIGKKPI